jgi:hypothetical protein
MAQQNIDYLPVRLAKAVIPGLNRLGNTQYPGFCAPVVAGLRIRSHDGSMRGGS